MKDSFNRRSWLRSATLTLFTAFTLTGGLISADAAQVGKGKVKGPGAFVNTINLTPTITSVAVQNGQLVANGFVTATVKGQTVTERFTAPVGFSPISQLDGSCPVLDLSLGPINLDLLGLVVETSQICLTLTAEQGGGLLGDLLCQIGGLLDGGLTIDQILSGQGLPLLGLAPIDVHQLTGNLTALLNALLGNLFGGVFDIIPGGSCEILHLEVGPLFLDLLGLVVELDDCDAGPVTVDITGETGQGKLLGNLLCGLLEGSGTLTLGQLIDGLLGLLNQ